MRSSKMRRIAIVTTSYPTETGDAAGHFVAAEAEELALAGHEVHVLCPGAAGRGAVSDSVAGAVRAHGCGGGDAFGWPGAVSRIRQKPWRSRDALDFVRRSRSTLHHLDRLGIDEIRAHWLLPSAWPIASSVKRPLRVMCHGGDVRLLCALPRPLRNRIVSDVVQRAERIAFSGRQLRQQLLSAVRDDIAARLEPMSAIESPLLIVAVPDPRERAATRATLCRDPARPLIAIIGRLVPGKRVDLAIRAVAAMRSRARLVIVGDGPERAALERLAIENGADVHFEGQRDRVTTHELMAACDILLHTSAKEGAPSVVREARVLGLPVVATASGDLEAWATRDPGIVVVAATAGALAVRLDGQC